MDDMSSYILPTHEVFKDGVETIVFFTHVFNHSMRVLVMPSFDPLTAFTIVFEPLASVLSSLAKRLTLDYTSVPLAFNPRYGADMLQRPAATMLNAITKKYSSLLQSGTQYEVSHTPKKINRILNVLFENGAFEYELLLAYALLIRTWWTLLQEGPVEGLSVAKEIISQTMNGRRYTRQNFTTFFKSEAQAKTRLLRNHPGSAAESQMALNAMNGLIAHFLTVIDKVPYVGYRKAKT